MRFANVSIVGRQVLRSVLLVSGVALGAMALGCGSAATAPVVDTTPPEDTAAMGADPEAALGSSAPAADAPPEGGN